MTSGALARTTRLVVGAVAALAVAAAGTALVVVELPHRGGSSVSVEAQPPATASVASCTGPLLAAGRDATQATLLTDAAASALTRAVDGADATVRRLAAPDVAGGAGPDVVSAPAAGDTRTPLAAAASATAAAEDLSGFAAAACTRAAMESWLVVGSGTTGAADLVVLANPGLVPAVVTLTLYGSAGETAPPAGQSIVVAAGTQRVIPLAALALGEENPIIRVTAAQAPVQASVQTSLTRVLDPSGVDQVAAIGAPGADIVIPGVPVTLAPGDPGASDVPTSLRLLAPAQTGEATVTVTDSSGRVGDPQSVQVLAGIPLQLDLAGLPVGTYDVRISATVPVTGAVWATTGFDKGDDFGWFTPAPDLTAPTLVAIAEGPAPQLTLISTRGGRSVTLEPLGGGTPQQVTLGPDLPTTVPVTAGESYRIVPDAGGVHAGVSFRGAGALAGYPVPAGDAEASAITVYPR